MKLLIPIVITVLLLAIPVYSQSKPTEPYQTYNETGNNNQFELGFGLFNTGLTSTDTTSFPIGSPRHMPLAADLDLDGTIEIIILDGGTLTVFDKYLVIIDS